MRVFDYKGTILRLLLSESGRISMPRAFVPLYRTEGDTIIRAPVLTGSELAEKLALVGPRICRREWLALSFPLV
jgi:hypothetical protein